MSDRKNPTCGLTRLTSSRIGGNLAGHKIHPRPCLSLKQITEIAKCRAFGANASGDTPVVFRTAPAHDARTAPLLLGGVRAESWDGSARCARQQRAALREFVRGGV